MKLFHYTSQVLHKHRKVSKFSYTISKPWNSYIHYLIILGPLNYRKKPDHLNFVLSE